MTATDNFTIQLSTSTTCGTKKWQKNHSIAIQQRC